MKTLNYLRNLVYQFIEDDSIVEETLRYINFAITEASSFKNWAPLFSSKELTPDSNGVIELPARCRTILRITTPKQGGGAQYEFQPMDDMPTEYENRLCQYGYLPYQPSMDTAIEIPVAVSQNDTIIRSIGIPAIAAYDFTTDSDDGSVLSGRQYWKNTGIDYNGEGTFHNEAGDYSQWNSTTYGTIFSAVADEGNEDVENYFSLQDYPDTITVSGAGTGGANGEYVYGGSYNDRGYWSFGIRQIRYYASESWQLWRASAVPIPEGIEYATPALIPPDEAPLPPETGWTVDEGAADAPTLTYTIPTDQFVGQGDFSGTLTQVDPVLETSLVGVGVTFDDTDEEFEIRSFSNLDGYQTFSIYPPYSGESSDETTAYIGIAGRERVQLINNSREVYTDNVNVEYQTTHPIMVEDNARLLIPCPRTVALLAIKWMMKTDKYDVDAQRLDVELTMAKREEIGTSSFAKKKWLYKDRTFAVRSNSTGRRTLGRTNTFGRRSESR